MKIGIDDQIAEVRREIAMRKRVYPAWVKAEKMSENEARDHMAKMEQALKTLDWVKAHAEQLREIAEVEK